MDRISEIIEASWRGETLEALKAFVRLPSKNRVFDPDWEKNGWLVRAVEDAARWGRQRFPKGRFEMHYRPGLTPVLVVDLPAEGDHTGRPAFFYGHFDKQPETEGGIIRRQRAPFGLQRGIPQSKTISDIRKGPVAGIYSRQPPVATATEQQCGGQQNQPETHIPRMRHALQTPDKPADKGIQSNTQRKRTVGSHAGRISGS